jgi:hypothetical protein
MYSIGRKFRYSVLGISLAVPLVWAAKEFSMPKVQPALSYPAHDHHRNENVTVGLDPYDTAAKAKIFVVNYHDHGLLPILLVITNDSDQPVELSDMKAQLVTGDRAKLSPATSDDLRRRITHVRPSGTRYPLPLPKAKGGLDSKELNEIESAQFRAKAVEPRASQAGFLFFDVSDVSEPLSGANFYLTGVRDSTGNELMYFEIPLDKYRDAGRSN